MNNIYDTAYVERLFDEMAGSYERVNYVTSFGFSKRWRRQVVARAEVEPGMLVCDLMCGMGECWPAVAKRLGGAGRLVALDLSRGMLAGAERRRRKLRGLDITLDRQNALSNSLADDSADCVISAFGVKTFSDEQKALLASEIRRILKPGGRFSLIEVSVPRGRVLRGLYMFYLKRLIPLIGAAFLGNPDNYRMLGVYTERFGDSRTMRDLLAREGLRVTHDDYFHGCATGVSGVKPLAPPDG
jgi:ubiquinone/menaquinone biosynthesis methyltransferase